MTSNRATSPDATSTAAAATVLTAAAPDTDRPTDVTPLTAQDRCDRCGARAYLRATLPSGTALLFCGHHGNAHRPSLLVAGAALHDETERLLADRETSRAA